MTIRVMGTIIRSQGGHTLYCTIMKIRLIWFKGKAKHNLNWQERPRLGRIGLNKRQLVLGAYKEKRIYEGKK